MLLTSEEAKEKECRLGGIGMGRLLPCAGPKCAHWNWQHGETRINHNGEVDPPENRKGYCGLCQKPEY